MFTAGASAADYYVRTGGADEASHDGLANTDARAWKTISYAIDQDQVTDGDTIHVAAGDYTENVDVNKAHLTLQGEGRDVVTVTAASAADHVFYVNADYVNISGFNATGAANPWNAGFRLSTNMDHCNISDNSASDNYAGIFLYHSSYNEITNNIANSNNYNGIRLEQSLSKNNEITGNTANSNSKYGIDLNNADNNKITCNRVAHNEQQGFRLEWGSTGNNISKNNIMHNGVLQGDGSYHWNFYNGQGDPVDAKHNYWVATTNETIYPSIFDDEEEKRKVTFYPFETSPPPCAPIPEAATIILFSIGLVVLVGYVWMRKRF